MQYGIKFFLPHSLLVSDSKVIVCTKSNNNEVKCMNTLEAYMCVNLLLNKFLYTYVHTYMATYIIICMHNYNGDAYIILMYVTLEPPYFQCL